jgi:serine/threonine protein kinase
MNKMIYIFGLMYVFRRIILMSCFVLDLAVALFKLCDFGLSEQHLNLIDTMRRSLSLDGSQVVGTALYRAPELFYNSRTRTKVTFLVILMCIISK